MGGRKLEISGETTSPGVAGEPFMSASRAENLKGIMRHEPNVGAVEVTQHKEKPGARLWEL